MTKRYQVRTTTTAERDVVSIRDYIASDNPIAAARWARKIARLILGLNFLPFRYEAIPEDVDMGREYRHIIIGNYRIIFSVLDDVVNVERVFHAARILTARHLNG